MYDKLERIKDDIKELNIVSVAKDYIELKKSGENYLALCPFHNDKRLGSFVMNEDLNMFSCFACGKTGDIFELVMQIKGLNFFEALVELAYKYSYITLEEYNFFLNEKPQVKVSDRKTIRRVKKVEKKSLNIETISKTYKCFLSNLTLNKNDLLYLKKERRISEKNIIKSEYKSLSFDTSRKEVIDRMKKELGDNFNYYFKETPGFFYNKKINDWDFTKTSGILIPVRNYKGDIRGIQVRRRTKKKDCRYIWFSSSFASGNSFGNSPGSPMDIVYPNKKKMKKHLFITEGRFKAEILSKYWGFTTISVQGVTNWKGIEKEILLLENKLGFKFQKIFIAFDSDLTYKKEVFKQLVNMANKISEIKDEDNIVILSWTQKYKGIDDLILNKGRKIKENKLISKVKLSNLDEIKEETAC